MTGHSDNAGILPVSPPRKSPYIEIAPLGKAAHRSPGVSPPLSAPYASQRECNTLALERWSCSARQWHNPSRQIPVSTAAFFRFFFWSDGRSCSVSAGVTGFGRNRVSPRQGMVSLRSSFPSCTCPHSSSTPLAHRDTAPSDTGRKTAYPPEHAPPKRPETEPHPRDQSERQFQTGA